MKVTNGSVGTNIQNVGVAREKGTEASDRLKDQKGFTSDKTDSVRVNVSDRAQAFQKAKAIASEQTIDEAKIARLQKLIDEGKYEFDAAAVADRLVDEYSNFSG